MYFLIPHFTLCSHVFLILRINKIKGDKHPPIVTLIPCCCVSVVPCLSVVQSELERQTFELSAAEDKLNKLTTELARLTDELRREQEKYGPLEKQKSTFENIIRDLQARLYSMLCLVVLGIHFIVGSFLT